MMLNNSPQFAPPIYNPIDSGMLSPPTNPFRKSRSVIRRGMAGLGMTMDEAKAILMNSGAYDAATVAQANQLYYGSTQSGSYQTTANQYSSPSPATCGSYPSQPSVVLMSTPQCSPSDSQCISLSQLIEEYNLALTKRSNNQWLRAVCEQQNCLNLGTAGYPRDCYSLYPDPYVPPQPNSPSSTQVIQTSGVATGYAPVGTPYGTVQTGYTPPTYTPVVAPSGGVVSGGGGSGSGSGAQITQPGQTQPSGGQPGEIQTTADNVTPGLPPVSAGSDGGIGSLLSNPFVLGGAALVLVMVLKGGK